MDVAIIIPVYNVEPYIGDCLRSVMRQTYQGTMECLLIDDCGTDESISIAERMIAEYNENHNANDNLNKGRGIQFKILHHEVNRGLSAARNTGTEHAKGDYIYYLDSDDEITDDCIEKMMAIVIKDSAIEMVQGKYDINGDSIPHPVVNKHQITSISTNWDARQSFYHRQIVFSAWNKLIKRSFLLQHHLLFKEGILHEDVLWLFYLMKYVSYIHLISDITYRHRKRPGSITTGTAKKNTAIHYSIVYQEIITHLTSGFEEEESRFYVRSFSICFCRYAKIEPTYQVVFSLYWGKVRQLKLYSCCLFLAIVYVIGKFKYGWMVYSLLIRLKHPRLLVRDIRHIWDLGK